MREAQALWSNRMREVATLVQTARVERGWSRSDLADRCADSEIIMTEQVVRSVETARSSTFNPSVIVPIVDALGISRKKYLDAAGFG